MLDQAESDIDRLMGAGQPDQVAAAFRFLLRLLASSSSRLKVGRVLDQHDTKVETAPKSVSNSAHLVSTPEIS